MRSVANEMDLTRMGKKIAQCREIEISHCAIFCFIEISYSQRLISDAQEQE